MDEHQGFAARWADAMLLFERIPPPRDSSDPRASGVMLDDAGHGSDGDGMSLSSASSSAGGSAAGVGAQMHVRRLWNRAGLLKRLEEMRRAAEGGGQRGVVATPARSRVGSPGVGNGGMNGNWSGSAGNVMNGNGNGNAGGQGWWNGGNGGRAPVALTVPVPRDIWW